MPGDAVSLSWGSVSVPEGCDSVRYALSRDGEHVVTQTATSYTERNVPPGRHCYRVLAESLPGGHESAESGARCVEVAPPTPSGLDVTKDADYMHSRIDVSWDRVSVADRYELRRSRDGGSYGPAFDPRSDTSHEDRGLDPETEYCYQVRAVGNGVESLWSGPECDTTGSEPEVMCPTPAAPTISTSLSGRTITVSWNGVSVEAGCTVSYRVFRDSSEIANTTSTSYADAGLSAGNYCYEVSAESSPGGSESAVSGSACETVPAVPPTNFAAAAASSSSVRLTWIAASGADSYEVRYRKTRESWEDWQDVGRVTGHTVEDLEADTEYEFEIRTVEGTETSMALSVTERTPPNGDPDPEPPTNFAALATGSSVIELSWNEVSGADSYEFQRRLSPVPTLRRRTRWMWVT